MELARRKLRSWPALLVGIFALAALVTVPQPERASAHAGDHVNMVFELEVGLGTILNVCTTTPSPVNACSVPVGGTSKLSSSCRNGT